MEHVIPEGTTENQDFILRDTDEDDVTTVIDVTGLTLGIEITDKHGDAVSGAGTASIVDGAAGQVRFAPTGSNLTKASGPYRVRWTVTDGSEMFKVPNQRDPDVWIVVDP